MVVIAVQNVGIEGEGMLGKKQKCPLELWKASMAICRQREESLCQGGIEYPNRRSSTSSFAMLFPLSRMNIYIYYEDREWAYGV